MLMAAMNSDVNDNILAAVLLPSFDAAAPLTIITILNASPPVVGVMEDLTALMEVTSEIVQLIVITAERPVIATVAPVRGGVMEEPSAMMEVMNETVEHTVTIAEGTAIAPPKLVQRDAMEDQSATIEAMNKIVGPVPVQAVTTAEGTVTVPR